MTFFSSTIESGLTSLFGLVHICPFLQQHLRRFGMTLDNSDEEGCDATFLTGSKSEEGGRDTNIHDTVAREGSEWSDGKE